MEEQEVSLVEVYKSFFNSFKRRAILIIVILGFVVFANGLNNDFVGDDFEQIINTPSTHSLINIGQFFSNSLKNYDYYRPIYTTGLSLIYSIGGPFPAPFHFFQLVLHILVTVFIFLVFKNFFREKLAFALSLIFLVHPINSEVVYYISDLQDVLFLLFGIIGFWFLMKAKNDKQFLLVAFFLLLSILSKETGGVFLLFYLVYIKLLRKEIFFKALPYLGVVVFVYIFLRLGAQNVDGLPWHSPIEEMSLDERLLHIPAIFFFYIKTFFLPWDLSVSYQWVIRTFDFRYFHLPLLFDLTFFTTLGFLAKKLHTKANELFKAYALFGVLFLGGLAMHLQIMPLAATVADRWFYLPMVGLLGMIGVLLEAYKVKLDQKWLVFFVIILFLFSGRSFVRSFDWKDNFTLSFHDAQVSESHILENAVSDGLLQEGKIEEAKIHSERSIKIFPNFVNYLGLANVYMYSHEYTKAEEIYRQGLQYSESPLIYDNLAMLYTQTGNDMNTAKVFVEEALEKYPRESVLWYSLAVAEYRLGNIDASKEAIKRASTLDNRAFIINFSKSLESGEKDIKYNTLP